MTKKQKVEVDAKIIGEAMEKYGGMDGAHFGFITFMSGERHFFLGGRCDLVGMCISEALVNLVSITDGIDESFIDLICETSKEMLKRIEKEDEIQ